MSASQELYQSAEQLHLAVAPPAGATEVVLFLHGWSCRASDWLSTIDALEGRWPVLVPDLPGHDGSHGVAWDDWTIVGLGRLVSALAESKGIERLHLVGHSMGGAVALEAARAWAEAHGQDALGAVVLVDTFGLPYGDMDADTIASIETPFHTDFVAAMHQLVDATTAAALPEETRRWVRERMASADPDKMLPLWADLLRWTPTRAFAELQCPILALNGEHIPEPAQQRCAERVNTQVLPGTHHFPLFEAPQAFVRELCAALDPHFTSNG
ncbi:alpha/beta fold hydrolase [Marinimicrobium alkaliphilum]|uniref:alpha/beta fold hydrolase n=1 Tax=Marinimicrobium alkaliphilum TaxID=2202654 RepID=UPI000DBA612B|nr:alpha/beta hydrolase [Marinimicrobium alkaliphilum]